MFLLKIIQNSEISPADIDEIIRIKSITWPYSYEKQLEWINSKIKDTDIHVLLYFDKSLVAYLNLIEIEVTLDSNFKKGYGIGNVCSLEKWKGWGKKIISETNTYLTQNNKIGTLVSTKLFV